jgi:glycosyltransferase involved in cell wall biosynthesis
VRDRYVDWGLPAERIEVQPYLVQVADRVPDQQESRPRDRFAFFGQLNPYKGADVLLEAMGILGEDFDGHLWIFGANLQIQAPDFREQIRELLSKDNQNVTMPGPYERSRLAKLMAGIDWVIVPSIWWETGPIVVLEAFQYGRPVICSDIGGMSEKVTDGVNGLHFRRRDAEHLAEVLQRAAETPGLWEELQGGIPSRVPEWTAKAHVETLGRVYTEALARRRKESATAGAVLKEVAGV